MAAKTKIECPGCRRELTIDTYRRHKEHPEICTSQRWYDWYHDNKEHWRVAGKHWRVLELAGLTRQVPIGSPRYITRPDGDQAQQWIPALVFYPIAPTWAFDLASRLQNDHELAAKLGAVEIQQRAGGRKWDDRTRKQVDAPRASIKVMAMWLRVRILRSAARSRLTREMAIDDLETVAILLRDQ